MNKKDEPLLPFSNGFEKSPVRLLSLLSHCLYRRVLIWTVTSLLLVSIVLYSAHDVNVYNVEAQPLGKDASSPDADAAAGTVTEAGDSNNKQEAISDEVVPEAIVVVIPGDKEKDEGQGQESEEEDNEAEHHQNEVEQQEQDKEEEDRKHFEEDLKKMPWLAFKQYDISTPFLTPMSSINTFWQPQRLL